MKKKNIDSYLGTTTILIIDSNEDWLKIYPKLRDKTQLKFTKDVYNKCGGDVAINLYDKGFESRGTLSWFETTKPYNLYTYIHSKNILNNKYRLWNLKI